MRLDQVSADSELDPTIAIGVCEKYTKERRLTRILVLTQIHALISEDEE